MAKVTRPLRRNSPAHRTESAQARDGSKRRPGESKSVDGSALSGANASVLRETLRARLRIAVEMVGSVAKTAALIGVNRTQFSRYLAGQSMPRPDLLYRLSQRLELPMEWFFDARTDPRRTLVEHQLGAGLRDRLAGRRITVTDDDLPDGFYVMWKRTFMSAMPYEMLLCHVSTKSGVKMMRNSMDWRRNLPSGRLPLTSQNRMLDFLIMRSLNGLYFLATTGVENRMITLYLRQSVPQWGSESRTEFAGIGIHGAFGSVGNSMVVPILMAQLSENDVGTVLKTARAAGGYEAAELPAPVRRVLEGLGVPQFQMLL